MTSRLRRSVEWGRQALLSVGAALGALCLVVAAASALFDVRPLVFESGSMAPTIQTGALAISHEVAAADLRVGDIVSVPTSQDSRVTHRIVAVTHRGELAELALKGDANDVADDRTYRVSHADRVVFDVPYLGFALAWMVGPVGLFLLGLYAAFLLSILVRRDTPPPTDGPTMEKQPRVKKGDAGKSSTRASADRSVVRALVVTGALGLLMQLGMPLPITQTLAAWNNPVGVDDASLQTYTVPPPVISSCTNGPAGTTSSRNFTINYSRIQSPAVSSSVSVTGITINSATVSNVDATTQKVVINYNPSGANQGKIVTTSIHAFLTSQPGWAGPVADYQTKTALSTGQGSCDAVGPTVSITAPTVGDSTTAQKNAAVQAACGTNRPLCGTATDAGAVTITYLLRRIVSGTTLYWNGSTAYGTAQTFRSTTGGNAFYASATSANYSKIYGTAGDYQLTVRAVDASGNQTDEVVTFTLS